MTIHKTTWSPDTCGCIIDVYWDDVLPQADRIETLKVDQPCSIHDSNALRDLKPEDIHSRVIYNKGVHKTKSDPAALVVLQENQNRQIALDQIKKHHNLTADEDIVESWSFEGIPPNRQFKLKLKKAKSDTQKIVNARLGTNKVIIS